jgi:hypothetical protein
MVLGLAVAAVVAVSALAGGNTATLDVAEAPPTGGNTPLAPNTLEEDLSDAVLFIEGEPVYDLDSIPAYDENGNLILDP